MSSSDGKTDAGEPTVTNTIKTNEKSNNAKANNAKASSNNEKSNSNNAKASSNNEKSNGNIEKSNSNNKKTNNNNAKANGNNEKANNEKANNEKANDEANEEANEEANNEECSSGSTHHISDVDTWGHPDKNYYIFVALSLFLGLIGADHFYLRSYDTALKKLLVNVGGLGFWYLWDVIQVLTEGSLIRKEGLSSPLDWIRGIGRGVFVPLPMEKKANNKGSNNKGSNNKGSDAKEYAAPKSYVIYTLLAILFGVFGADKFYLGYTGQGLAKIFSVFNIFLFLFGLLWVLWDAFNAFFRTETLLKEGIAAPLPYSIFFKTPIPAEELFKVQEVKGEEEPTSEPSSGTNWGGLYNQFIVPLLQPTVGKAVQTANQAVTVGSKGLAVAKKVGSMNAASLTGPLAEASGQAAQAQVAQATQASPEQPTTVQTIQEIAAAKAAERSAAQTGGAHTSTGGLGPVIAGSLTALVLAGGLRGIYEFLERRHG